MSLKFYKIVAKGLKLKVGKFLGLVLTFVEVIGEELVGSLFVFVFISEEYVENFTLNHLLLFEICACEICEKFVYKHGETIEYVKN